MVQMVKRLGGELELVAMEQWRTWAVCTEIAGWPGRVYGENRTRAGCVAGGPDERREGPVFEQGRLERVGTGVVGWVEVPKCGQEPEERQSRGHNKWYRRG